MFDKLKPLPGLPPHRPDQFTLREIKQFKRDIGNDCAHMPIDRVAAEMAREEEKLNNPLKTSVKALFKFPEFWELN